MQSHTCQALQVVVHQVGTLVDPCFCSPLHVLCRQRKKQKAQDLALTVETLATQLQAHKLKDEEIAKLKKSRVSALAGCRLQVPSCLCACGVQSRLCYMCKHDCLLGPYAFTS